MSRGKAAERLLQFAEHADGEALKLPLSMLMQTIFLGGNKGAGKTSAMKRLFEAAHGAGAQCGVIAPLGRWWSLRIAKNGRGRGLKDVFVFGGKHGDVGVTAASGRSVARTVVHKRIHFVLDVELMRKDDRAQFVGDFLEELWQLKKEEDASNPMVLFIDEAQTVAPQKSTDKLVNRMREFAADLCREGRNHGVGMVLGAQRSANVDKDLLALVEMLIVMRTIHHLDRKVYQSWVDEKGDSDDDEGAWLKRLRRLEKGQAYLYAPELSVFERVQILLPDTYDATKTAELGAKVAKVGSLSKLDVRRLGEELTQVVAEAEANDPAKLRARVAQLERELAAKPQGYVTKATAQVKPPKVDKQAQRLLVREGKFAFETAASLARTAQALKEIVQEFAKHAAKLAPLPMYPVEVLGSRAEGQRQLEKIKNGAAPLMSVQTVFGPMVVKPNGHVKPAPAPTEPPGEFQPVGKQKVMLGVLMNGPLTRDELAGAVSQSQGGTFNEYVRRLIHAGYVEESSDGLIHVTNKGSVGVTPISMKADDILARNSGYVVGKMKMMVAAIRAAPRLTKDQLIEHIGQSPGGTANEYVRRLVAREIFSWRGDTLTLSPMMERGERL